MLIIEESEIVKRKDVNSSRSKILGIDFDLITPEAVFEKIEDWKRNNEQHYITFTNPHSVLLCHRDEEMKVATERASIILPDGIGIIYAANLLGYTHYGRVSGPDTMLKLCDLGQNKGYKHFFFGGKKDVAKKLAEQLSEKFPGLQVAGTYYPPFRLITSREDDEVLQMINDTNPDIIWVGLGAPKQEKWMAYHIGHVKATAMIGVGAAFDFHSGNLKRSPFWFQKYGLEWLYRLSKDPKRLWRRNLDSPVFLSKILYQRFFHKNNNGFKI